MNVSYGPIGEAGGVLLRGGEIVVGETIARERRPGCERARNLARGPGNLGAAVGVDLSDNGTDLLTPSSRIRLERDESGSVTSSEGCVAGPRMGVSRAADRPWRLWLSDSGSVSAYRRSPRATPVRQGMG